MMGARKGFWLVGMRVVLAKRGLEYAPKHWNNKWVLASWQMPLMGLPGALFWGRVQ